LPKHFTEELYTKYHKYILTPEELRQHLYPSKQLPLYNDFHELTNSDNNKPEQKNKMLIVDCEMVISEAGFELARATIVNFEGEVIFDELFKPSVEIINYNTEFSGITQAMLEPVTNTLQNKLYPFLETIVCPETIMVGHSLENDLRAMKLIHNKVIDSSVLFMTKSGSKFKLKNLADRILRVSLG
jgi:RNA exonuclease 1